MRRQKWATDLVVRLPYYRELFAVSHNYNILKKGREMAIGVLMTPREIAERLGVNVNVVRDLIEQAPDVRPAAFADSIPIFDKDVVARLRHELHKRTALSTEVQGDE